MLLRLGENTFDEPDVPIVAATDSVRALPRMISSWLPGRFVALGTDGFGLSERREALRTHFKVVRRRLLMPPASSRVPDFCKAAHC